MERRNTTMAELRFWERQRISTPADKLACVAMCLIFVVGFAAVWSV